MRGLNFGSFSASWRRCRNPRFVFGFDFAYLDLLSSLLKKPFSAIVATEMGQLLDWSSDGIQISRRTRRAKRRPCCLLVQCAPFGVRSGCSPQGGHLFFSCVKRLAQLRGHDHQPRRRRHHHHHHHRIIMSWLLLLSKATHKSLS